MCWSSCNINIGSKTNIIQQMMKNWKRDVQNRWEIIPVNETHICMYRCNKGALLSTPECTPHSAASPVSQWYSNYFVGISFLILQQLCWYFFMNITQLRRDGARGLWKNSAFYFFQGESWKRWTWQILIRFWNSPKLDIFFVQHQRLVSSECLRCHRYFNNICTFLPSKRGLGSGACSESKFWSTLFLHWLTKIMIKIFQLGRGGR